MNFITKKWRTLALSAFAAGSVFATAAFAQADLAGVEFIVNVSATINAVSVDDPTVSKQIDVKASEVATLELPVVSKITGVSSSAAQKKAIVPAIRNIGGRISVSLPEESYKNAELSLYSVSGKRVLYKRVSAGSGRITQGDIATGVYMLSVKGVAGNKISSRITHGGGRLDIDVAIGDNVAASRANRLSKKASAGEWRITISADGYIDTTYKINVNGQTVEQQVIMLREIVPVNDGRPITIIFEPAGGVVSSKSEVSGNDWKLTSLPTATRSGYTFNGWFTAASGGRKVLLEDGIPIVGGIGPDRTITVYAQWTVGTIDSVVIGTQTWMKKDLNIETDGSWCHNGNCENYNREYSWEAAKKACPWGWHLPTRDEWGTLAKFAGGKGAYGASNSGKAGAKLKSKSGWAKRSTGSQVGDWFAGLYDYITGDYDAEDRYGFSALPTARSYGYFNGWWTATDGYSRRMLYDSPYIYEGTEKEWNLSVRCVSNTPPKPQPQRTITLNPNGGTVLPVTIGTGPGGQLLEPLPTPTRSGYTFNGWFTAATGGEEVDDYSVYSANTTLYAHWLAGIVTVTFNPNGGTVTPTTATVNAGEKLASLPTPTRSGYTFNGWYTAATGGTAVTAAGSVFSADATIYAQWTINIATVTFDPNGGVVSPTTAKTGAVVAGKLDSLFTPSRSGYIFDGWFTVATGGTAVTSETLFYANTTIYAHWTETSYTITFDLNGGGTVSPTTAKTGADGKLTSLPTPTRSGYTFDGWYLTSAGGGKVTTSRAFSHDATIYASWTEVVSYESVVIGTQTWMKKNLNIETADSWCYENKTENCAKYGRLYTWTAAKTACPTGWHLPSRAEWGTLAEFAGGTGDYGANFNSTAGEALKSTSGWNTSNTYDKFTGTDAYGFSALPGGGWKDWEYNGSYSFHSVGENGMWWTATESPSFTSSAYYRIMAYNYNETGEYTENKNTAYSVRCIAD